MENSSGVGGGYRRSNCCHCLRGRLDDPWNCGYSRGSILVTLLCGNSCGRHRARLQGRIRCVPWIRIRLLRMDLRFGHCSRTDAIYFIVRAFFLKPKNESRCHHSTFPIDCEVTLRGRISITGFGFHFRKSPRACLYCRFVLGRKRVRNRLLKSQDEGLHPTADIRLLQVGTNFVQHFVLSIECGLVASGRREMLAPVTIGSLCSEEELLALCGSQQNTRRNTHIAGWQFLMDSDYRIPCGFVQTTSAVPIHTMGSAPA